jgi:hypothetical protein
MNRISARATLTAALLAFALPANAEPGLPRPIDMPIPEPISLDRCVTAEAAFGDLQRNVAIFGGVAGIMKDEAAQAFADEWRTQAGAELTGVTVVFIWVRGPVTIAEVDDRDCLVTMTEVSIEAFARVLDALPDRRPSVAV